MRVIYISIFFCSAVFCFAQLDSVDNVGMEERKSYVKIKQSFLP